jgi:hypothetical protein
MVKSVRGWNGNRLTSPHPGSLLRQAAWALVKRRLSLGAPSPFSLAYNYAASLKCGRNLRKVAAFLSPRIASKG